MMDEKMILKDYPYNLLIEAKGKKILELPASLTKDIQAGIVYALFTLDETEQNILNQKYCYGIPLSDDQKMIEKKALKKLCHPSRWDYICFGVVGNTKRKVDEAGKKGFVRGYHEGYEAGVKAYNRNVEATENLDVMDLPIETMLLSARVSSALRANGCWFVRDVVTQKIEIIRRMRLIGPKAIKAILQVLHSYGFVNTEWELF